jgi:gamma-glutamyltranspeptidase/glutathione hydrolase
MSELMSVADRSWGDPPGGYGTAEHPLADSMRPSVVGQSWALSVGHPLVASLTADVFRSGGNAVDAGVAAAILSTVVQPDMCNFGGIAPMLIRAAAGAAVVSVAGVGRWSTLADIEEMRRTLGESIPRGSAASIVPGAPAALIAALARYGTMSWEEVSEPVCSLAREGFPVDGRLAASLEVMRPRISAWGGSTETYAPAKPWSEGALLRQTGLAGLLDELVGIERAARGSREDRLRAVHRAFYEGDIARLIVDFVSGSGGCLVLGDLAAFEAEIDQAPTVVSGDWLVASSPSWSQGPLALQALAVMDELILRGVIDRSASPRAIACLARALDAAFADREAYFGDPDVMEPPPEYILSVPRVREQADRVMANEAGPWSSQSSGTTAVVTMDARGQTFACTPSDTLDTGPIIPGLGIMCSPRGVQSRLRSGHPNQVRAGRRPCVTPSSLIAVRRDRAGGAWALSCPGGDVIVQALAQVFWAVDAGGLSLQEAVESPRWAHQGHPNAFSPHRSRPGSILVEPGIAAAALTHLSSAGYDLEPWPPLAFSAGSVQTVRDVGPPGRPVIIAAADPRRSAYALAR